MRVYVDPCLQCGARSTWRTAAAPRESYCDNHSPVTLDEYIESRRDQRDNDAVDRWRDRQMEDC